MAAKLAAPFGLERAAYLAGLLHDLGKYTPAFQKRLTVDGDGVDHSTAGAAHIQKLVTQPAHEALLAQSIAYCILGHHAGLPDRLGPSGYEERIDRFEKDARRSIDPIWRAELDPEVRTLFPAIFKSSKP